MGLSSSRTYRTEKRRLSWPQIIIIKKKYMKQNKNWSLLLRKPIVGKLCPVQDLVLYIFLIRQKEGKHLNRWWHVLRKSLKSNSLNIKLYNSLPVKNRHIFHNYKHWTKNIVNASTSVTCVFQKSIRMNTIRDYQCH